MRNKACLLGLVMMLLFSSAVKKTQSPYSDGDYKLVWADEFSKEGRPDERNWTFERGFVRNQELQWYQPGNAYCKAGMLVIEARKERKPNPDFLIGSNDWRRQRKYIDYTSACLITRNLQSWQYGRFIMRGKITVDEGLWPAFWTLGENGRWPANGEIDIMEYYNSKILANIASCGKDGQPKWFSSTKRLSEIGNEKWPDKFHVWQMDWDSESISLFVDGLLLNKTKLSELDNDDRNGQHPFKQKHYILLDLALGGVHGGDPSVTGFPRKFEIDYVRVYQK